MKNAAVGFRPHSGWTALVAVSLERGKPVVLLRESVHLAKTFNYAFRQPYHTAAKAPLEEGRAFIAQVRDEARQLACRALRQVQTKLSHAEYRLTCSGHLQGAGRALPDLEKILAAHPLIHTAEGEFFREVLLHASKEIGLAQFQVTEKELLQQACTTLRRKKERLQTQLTALARRLAGPPCSCVVTACLTPSPVSCFL